jgi:SAM-dependent methyltransferase
MDPLIYEEMLEQENTHWWFCSRRKIVGSLLQSLTLKPNANILEAGCGSGGNLPMLSGLGGKLFAFEMYDKAREHAAARKIANVESGKLPDSIPFIGTNFDLICLFDVLEHVEDDNAALKALAARMNTGGSICISVPAYQWLFVRHDRLHHHFRRYSKSELIQKIKVAGLQVEFVNYWNFFLFPVALLIRILDLFNYPKNHTIGSKKPSETINRLMFKLVSSERFVLPFMKLPFGLSLLLIAKKP